ncbi:EscU/YscU/HrcU family type III secretion system export apparatus switch protein [Mediterraneibacter sp. NSJ-55]|uniref:EscU/YscU/HrcU family type III secretion system export apparatus switch protein n=1 Tax=Mediterraneibacter hominis TaxID=2763054 RepID=A0A923LJD6_9FIRM|nr:EscU/YscU/HrcU family type III secretion system export apparatus switch protein [Mediterraneibacter hominis]MBC5689329.1 EscU/YscU/HrcU family type III secretion system export apparatus switch protein [Mediterraneibacter hominis]
MSAFDNILNQKAAALSYDEEGQAAPVIVASGSGYTAQKIIETARESGVPVYEDNSLATVLTQLELGAEIPQELYAAIVEIYVYFLKYGKNGPVKEETVEEAKVETEKRSG